jgi:hypothetical protein
MPILMHESLMRWVALAGLIGGELPAYTELLSSASAEATRRLIEEAEVCCISKWLVLRLALHLIHLFGGMVDDGCWSGCSCAVCWLAIASISSMLITSVGPCM